MSRKPKPYRPEPVPVGSLRARVVRGPHPDDGALPEADRRWYWRVWRGEEDLGSIGWHLPADVARIVAEKHTISGDDGPAAREALAGTIGALIDAYLAKVEARRDLAPNTKANARRNLGHVRDRLCDVRGGQFNTDTLAAYQAARLADGAATGTVAVEIDAIQAAWRWGSQSGRSYAPRRLVLRPPLEVRPTREKYTPSDADIEAALREIPEGSWQRLGVSLLYQTGARVHELAVLRPADVDYERLVIEIPDEPEEGRRTKTGRRTVKIRPALAEEIKAFCEAHDVALDDDERPLLGVALTTVRSSIGGHERSRGGARKDERRAGALAEACDRAGVKRFTPHGLRRAVVRRFRRAGVPVGVAAAYFGHSVKVMIEMYDEVSEEDQGDALALLDAYDAARKPATRGARRTRTAVTPEA
jgi:integrase